MFQIIFGRMIFMMKDIFIKFLKLFNRPVICFGIFLWAMYLRYERLAQRNLWVDETNRLAHTVGDFQSLFKRWSYGDLTYFPGHYLVSYPFVQISQNKWVINIPTILITIFGFYILYKLAQYYYKTIWGFIIAFLVMCFNRELIFHDFEFRAYSFLPALALITLYVLTQIFYRYNDLSKVKRGLLCLSLLLVIWFNLAGMVMVVFLSFFFILDHKEITDRGIVVSRPIRLLIGTVLISVPLWFWYANDTRDNYAYSNLLAGGLTTFQYIANPMVDIIAFLKSIFGALIGFKKFYPFLIPLIVSFLVPHQNRNKLIGFFLFVIILPIETQCLIATLKGYWFLQRQFIWVVPLFAFLLGWACDSLINEFVIQRRNVHKSNV